MSAIAGECATTSYVIPEPFDPAVKLVRLTLTAAGLKITGELNLSQRIQRRLLIRTPPCLVLFAAPEAAAEDAGEPGLTPLHVVVSDRGAQTEVHLLKVPQSPGAGGGTLRLPARLQSVLSRALGSVGMQHPIGA